MKSRQFAEMLTEFASLADRAHADQLRKLAAVFAMGDDDTVAVRLKKMSRSHSHPAGLCRNLGHIRSGLAASGAKQATIVEKLLALFAGPGDADLTDFLQQITRPPQRRPVRAKTPPAADYLLAKTMADRLTASTLDTATFSEVVKELRSSKLVNTPTLIYIAHRYLGNDKPYQGRKTAIDDIVERQKADAREHARGKALSRVGV